MKSVARLVIVIALLFTPSIQAAQLVLSGVPQYYWYYGCAPTSGGMLVGYWDANGYDLVEGDISTYNATAKTAIASVDHINDYYIGTGDAAGTDSGSHVDNSIADFMDTSVDPLGKGGTYDISYAGKAGIAQGLQEFASWDNPDTAGTNESHSFVATTERTTARPDLSPTGDFSFTDLINEIDAGNPLTLNGLVPEGGHTIVAYGYQDNPGTTNDWVAVYDTWGDGLGGGPTNDKIEGGHEWWPWDIQNDGDNYYWVSATTFVPSASAPEPGSIILFGFGIMLLYKKKQRKNCAYKD